MDEFHETEEQMEGRCDAQRKLEVEMADNLCKPRPVRFDFDSAVEVARAHHVQWLRNRVEDLENETPEGAEERRMEAAEYTRERLRLDCMEFTDGEEDE